MSYKVLETFPDARDKCHIYKKGDTYPRDGVTPTDERINELLGETNGRGRAVIEEAKGSKTKKGTKKEEA